MFQPSFYQNALTALGQMSSFDYLIQICYLLVFWYITTRVAVTLFAHLCLFLNRTSFADSKIIRFFAGANLFFLMFAVMLLPLTSLQDDFSKVQTPEHIWPKILIFLIGLILYIRELCKKPPLGLRFTGSISEEFASFREMNPDMDPDTALNLFVDFKAAADKSGKVSAKIALDGRIIFFVFGCVLPLVIWIVFLGVLL